MFSIDLRSGVPIYEQVYRAVIKLGAAGAFGESGQLPSVRAVAKDLGVNPNTVQRAYTQLERDGIILSLPGKGSFLAAKNEIQERRKTDALKQVRQAVGEALRCGVTEKELQEILQKEEEAL